MGVLRLEQLSRQLLKGAPVGLWLPLLQRFLSLLSLAYLPPLGPATLPQSSSDNSHQQTAPQVPLIGIAINESLQCLALTAQGRNGETWKER